MFTYLINPLLCNWSCITVIHHYHLLLSATGALLILLSVTSFVIPEILPRPWVDFLLLCTGSFSTLCCLHSLSFSPCSDSVLEHPPSHHAEVQDSPTPSTGPHFLDFDIQFWTVLIMDTLLILFGLWYPMWSVLLHVYLSCHAWIQISCAWLLSPWSRFFILFWFWHFVGLLFASVQPFHPAHAAFPPYECLIHSALTPMSPSAPKHTDVYLALPLPMAFALNYYTEGKGEEEKVKS